MRLWRTSRAQDQPFPILVEDDDVLQYMIVEAVAVRVQKEDAKEQKKDEVKGWKKDKAGLDRLKSAARR